MYAHNRRGRVRPYIVFSMENEKRATTTQYKMHRIVIIYTHITHGRHSHEHSAASRVPVAVAVLRLGWYIILL